METPEDCYNWAKKADPTATYFAFKTVDNWHCSPCLSTYGGGTDGIHSGDGYNIYKMNNPPSYTPPRSDAAKTTVVKADATNEWP